MPKPMTIESFLAKAKSIHGEQYDYSKVDLVQKKIEIVCPEHGSFFQTIAVHLYDKCGCKPCGNKKKSVARRKNSEVFIEQAKAIHGDKYDYSKVDYKTSHDKVKIICPKHGEFEILPYAHTNESQKQGCYKCGIKNRINPNQGTTDRFIKKAQDKWSSKYDYSITNYINKMTKIEYKCSIHGTQQQLPYQHLKHGCQYCSGRGISKHSKTSFINIASKIHNNKYNYEKVEFLRITDKVVIKCPKHGEFITRANNHIHLANGCPNCVIIISRPQQEIYDYIKTIYNNEIIHNDRKILSGKEIDIYLPDKKIGFEYHGLYFHTETSLGKKYHYNKFLLAKEAGIKLIQIYENEWLLKKDILKSKISNMLGISNRIYARNTYLVKVDKHKKIEFLTENHLQGSDNAPIAYGLKNNEELVALMTFGGSRFNRSYEYELVRFCNKKYTSVVGGASKLFKQFVKDYNKSVVTYADKRYSDGNLYKQMGFELNGETKPSFAVVDIKNGALHSRMNFKRKDLQGEGTAYDIMLQNGYDRIWDCGQYRYVWLPK